MNERNLGSQGPRVPECGLGCWQIGGGWGAAHWDNGIAQEIVHAAYDSGVRFFDTADVYGDGESERSVGAFRESHPDIFIATKLGRVGMYPDDYTESGLRAATEASLERLGVDCLDLTQLHCIPTAVLREGKVFDWLRRQRDEGLITRFGASVESVEEGLLCLDQEGLCSLQVIFNIFRQKPLEALLPRARQQGVGIVVRLPLASGLLTGRLTRATTFQPADHRNFNRDGQQFNVGETFAGLPYEKGVQLSEELREWTPHPSSMAQMALRWILDHEAVSVVIPGASSPEQARANATAADLPRLPEELHGKLAGFYQQRVREHIRGPY
jgi:aryl-alcohol dehydrogenase-like predicted oxidoreductase